MSVLFTLLYIELIPFFRLLKNHLIDNTCWAGSRAIVFVFLLPIVGAPAGYVGLFFAGTVLIACLFQGMATIMNVVDDVEKRGTVSYELLLPLSQRLIFIKFVLAHTVRALIYGLMFLLLAKLLMWNAFDLSMISGWKTILSFILLSVFTGVFSLFCASYIYDASDISFVWRSWVYPLFIIGGHLFPWKAVSSISTCVGLLFLLNPMMHASESIRAALLGQTGYLPFWITSLGLAVFAFLFGIFGFFRFRKRLDML